MTAHHRWPTGMLLGAIMVLAAGVASIAGERADRPLLDRPTVRVVSPSGGGFILAPSSGARLIIVLEIVDGTGAGIDTNDSGMPKFVDANKNVDLFVQYAIARRTYTNSDGQTVLQIVSEIPVDNLKTDGYQITPPIDRKRMPGSLKGKAFEIPMELASDAADFIFQVRDRKGELSDRKADGAMIFLGIGANVWVPQADIPTLVPDSIRSDRDKGAPPEEGIEKH